jgi:hypothetical protein
VGGNRPEPVDTVQWYPKVMRKDFTVGLSVTEAGVDDPDQQFFENYVCGHRNRRKLGDSGHFEQAPPRSWDQFEELCADTFQEEWQDSTLVRHGRTGQTQHGVDIVGRDGANWPVGIQCKRKSMWPVSEVTTRDLDDEVEKAKNFKPALRAFYLVSTAPDDQPLPGRGYGNRSLGPKG